MMNSASQAWNQTAFQVQHEVLESAYFKNKKLYRLMLERASTVLKTRLPKLLEEPRAERHARLAPLLGTMAFDLITQNLLADWLFHHEQKMMAAFLDSLGISHDGSGCVDQFPETMEEEKLKKAVDHLYQTFDGDKVTLYLRIFEAVASCRWPALAGLIRSETNATV